MRMEDGELRTQMPDIGQASAFCEILVMLISVIL